MLFAGLFSQDRDMGHRYAVGWERCDRECRVERPEGVCIDVRGLPRRQDGRALL